MSETATIPYKLVEAEPEGKLAQCNIDDLQTLIGRHNAMQGELQYLAETGIRLMEALKTLGVTFDMSLSDLPGLAVSLLTKKRKIEEVADMFRNDIPVLMEMFEKYRPQPQAEIGEAPPAAENTHEEDKETHG